MNIDKQRGMSLIGFILSLALGLFVAFLGMKIGPIYLENYSVVNAMQNLAAEPGSAKLSMQQARSKLLFQMNLSYVGSNVQAKHITLNRGNGVNLRVAYEVREPIIGNLDVIVTFDKSVRLTQ